MLRHERAGLRTFLAGEGGVSAVEFAIVAPLFIVILAGILLYGIYFGVALSVSQVAAESARASIAGLDDTERNTLAQNRASAMVASNPILDATKITVAAAPDPSSSHTFKVDVTYDASNLPIFAFGGLIPAPSQTIVRTSTIQRGGF